MRKKLGSFLAMKVTFYWSCDTEDMLDESRDTRLTMISRSSRFQFYRATIGFDLMSFELMSLSDGQSSRLGHYMR